MHKCVSANNGMDWKEGVDVETQRVLPKQAPEAAGTAQRKKTKKQNKTLEEVQLKNRIEEI